MLDRRGRLVGSARGLLVALALLAGATACGDDGDTGPTATGSVRPFAEVQASDLSFEMDPSDPGRALFRVTTTVPMICSITWGETEALGNQNNSLSMDGSGIDQHDVILPGAAADTRYHFSVQGADAEGNLYQSGRMTVTIPATGSVVFREGSTEPERTTEGGPGDEAPATTDPRAAGENLALGAEVVDVSSEFGESFAAELAIDDDLATEWSSRDDGDDAFLELDLGAPREIAGVEFVTRSMADDTAITATFTVTVDGMRSGPFDAGNVRNPRFASLEGVTGQVVRFEVETSSGGNTGAVEVRVLAPPG